MSEIDRRPCFLQLLEYVLDGFDGLLSPSPETPARQGPHECQN